MTRIKLNQMRTPVPFSSSLTFTGEKVKIEATSVQEGENVAVGVAPLFYLRIKRDAANNLEMWIDDTNTDKVASFAPTYIVLHSTSLM